MMQHSMAFMSQGRFPAMSIAAWASGCFPAEKDSAGKRFHNSFFIHKRLNIIILQQ